MEQNVNVNTLIKGTVGDGEEVRFWINWWHGDCALKDTFPALFNLENQKSATVRMRVENWDWRREVSSTREQDEWFKIQQMMNGLTTSATQDKWERVVNIGAYVTNTAHHLHHLPPPPPPPPPPPAVITTRHQPPPTTTTTVLRCPPPPPPATTAIDYHRCHPPS
ncbi:excretory canal abnormal protein 6-like [Helianthus annuus]|uniref:excretory canal abnormal protein 6-like n=1 Tax=Helianthus annuus TaxID=4232 RepID=UPI000B8F3F6C|nr:excretory canal abnormal protein 6-like [Helianthus annuus]